MNENIIAGLDIGSTHIRLVVGQLHKTREGQDLKIIGAVEQEAQGINRGAVNSIEDVTSSISASLDKAERLMGVPISSAWVGINSYQTKCETSKGVIAVGKSNGEITEEDVDRVIDAARALSMPPNSQILHVIPVKFTVDNQEDIKDPVGMTGLRLEVETLIIRSSSTEINNLTKAIYRTGLDIDDLVLSPLAASMAVMNAKQKEIGSVLINIGASTTSLAVFEERELIHSAILRIGSEYITKDLALVLRCPIDLAEKIKQEYGSANPDQFSKKDLVDITELAQGYEDQIKGINPISRKHIAEIIEARVEEIFEKIDRELKKIDRSGMLPAGAFLIGEGVKLDGLADVAKKQLRLPVSIGGNKNVQSVIGKVNDPKFLNALGLVVWGSENSSSQAKFSLSKMGGNVKDGFGKMASWLRSIIP